MAWIESHQSLLHHKKTNRAIALLKVNRYKFIGHLHALWWWALDNAPTGNLEDLMPAEIADAAGWDVTKGDEFVHALTAVGFIDEVGDGEGLVLHDWEDYAGRFLDLKAARKEAGRRGGLASGEARRSKTAKQNEAKVDLLQAKPRSNEAPTDQPNQPNQPNHTKPTDLPTRSAARSLWENRIGFLSSVDSQEFREYESVVPETWFLEAIDVTVEEANNPSWAFCRSVLKRCMETQKPPRAKAKPPQEKPHSVADVLAKKKARAAV